MTPESSRYLRIVKRFTQLLNEHKISPDEYACNVLDQSQFEDDINSDIATQVINEMPSVARQSFADHVHAALAPGFRVSVHVGGPGPGPVPLAEMSDEYTRRVQAWAAMFVELLKQA